jgi:hypothetical protein
MFLAVGKICRLECYIIMTQSRLLFYPFLTSDGGDFISVLSTKFFPDGSL